MSKAVLTALRAAPKQLSIPFNKLPALQSNCASKKFGVLKSPLMLELESSTSAIACSFLLSEKERCYFKKINRIIFFNQRHSKTGPYCRKSFKENGGWKCQSRANYLPGRKEISFTFTFITLEFSRGDWFFYESFLCRG